jgi:hypothetical protein
MHDVKNLVSRLSFLLANAGKYGGATDVATQSEDSSSPVADLWASSTATPTGSFKLGRASSANTGGASLRALIRPRAFELANKFVPSIGKLEITPLALRVSGSFRQLAKLRGAFPPFFC